MTSKQCTCRKFEEKRLIELDRELFRACLQQSLTQVFGRIGGAVPFEVLSVQQESGIVLLKTDKGCVLVSPIHAFGIKT